MRATKNCFRLLHFWKSHKLLSIINNSICFYHCAKIKSKSCLFSHCVGYIVVWIFWTFCLSYLTFHATIYSFCNFYSYDLSLMYNVEKILLPFTIKYNYTLHMEKKFSIFTMFLYKIMLQYLQCFGIKSIVEFFYYFEGIYVGLCFTPRSSPKMTHLLWILAKKGLALKLSTISWWNFLSLCSFNC